MTVSSQQSYLSKLLRNGTRPFVQARRGVNGLQVKSISTPFDLPPSTTKAQASFELPSEDFEQKTLHLLHEKPTQYAPSFEKDASIKDQKAKVIIRQTHADEQSETFKENKVSEKALHEAQPFSETETQKLLPSSLVLSREQPTAPLIPSSHDERLVMRNAPLSQHSEQQHEGMTAPEMPAHGDDDNSQPSVETTIKVSPPVNQPLGALPLQIQREPLPRPQPQVTLASAEVAAPQSKDERGRAAVDQSVNAVIRRAPVLNKEIETNVYVSPQRHATEEHKVDVVPQPQQTLVAPIPQQFVSAPTDEPRSREGQHDRGVKHSESKAPKLTIHRLDVQIINQAPVVPPEQEQVTPAPAPQTEKWESLDRYHLGRFYLSL